MNINTDQRRTRRTDKRCLHLNPRFTRVLTTAASRSTGYPGVEIIPPGSIKNARNSTYPTKFHFENSSCPPRRIQRSVPPLPKNQNRRRPRTTWPKLGTPNAGAAKPTPTQNPTRTKARPKSNRINRFLPNGFAISIFVICFDPLIARG